MFCCNRFLVAVLALPLAGFLATAQEPRATLPQPAPVSAMRGLPSIPAADARAAQVPAGFTVQVVAADLTYPTSITFGDQGAIFVAEAGYTEGDDSAPARVIRIVPNGTRFRNDVVVDGLVRPVKDVLWRDGRLYIAHANRIGVVAAGQMRDLATDLPSNRTGLISRRGRTGMDFASDATFGAGWMYLAMAGNTLLTSNEAVFGIVRVNPDTLRTEMFLGARPEALGPVGLEHVATAGPRRPVECRFGPDGALYVVDFGAIALERTATGTKAHPIRGTGVVWRIAATGHEVMRPAIVEQRPVVTPRTLIVEKPALVETPVALLPAGIVRGVVIEGPRLQPSIAIELLDSTGNRIATKTTGPDGSFEFGNVPPGSYKLFSIKPYSMSQGEAAVIVGTGKVANVRLEIMR